MIGELIGDRYELEELVGSGGMSSVFRARDALLERRVALKVLHDRFNEDAEYVERFRHEARAAAQLSHPNIVTVIDRGVHEGRQFIVLEYLEGRTLKQLVEREGPLPVRRALVLGFQVARALAFAHASGLVHRDVKPQNVVVDDGGAAKVTDFGIARALEGKEGLTQTGTVLGTSDYISPEQAQGRKVDALSDVYSLGIVLYELLTGELPFPGDNFVAVALRHVNEPAPSLLERRPDAPARVAAAVQRAMAKDPRERFPSMRAFAAELAACLGELGEPGSERTMIVAPGPSSEDTGRLPAPRRRRAWPWVAALGAVAAAAAAVLVLPGLHTGGGGSDGSRGGSSAAAAEVSLRAVAAYDPEGDGHEHDSAVPLATDGKQGTYWQTEHYKDGLRGARKSGVGIVLDAGAAARLGALTVTSDTPGFTAVVKAGPSAHGPFRAVGSPRTVGDRTTFTLDPPAAERYYLLWITDLGRVRSVHVNEVTAG